MNYLFTKGEGWEWEVGNTDEQIIEHIIEHVESWQALIGFEVILLPNDMRWDAEDREWKQQPLGYYATIMGWKGAAEELPHTFTEQEVKDGRVNLELMKLTFTELPTEELQTEFYVWCHNTFDHCRIR